MFNRRKKPSLIKVFIELVWPSMGWRRLLKYVAFRISRLPNSPRQIATGFALGAAVSFTPFIGFHILIGALLAWILRANIFASAIGTIIGNPWTFPFIWVWIYNLGIWMGFGNKQVSVYDLNFSSFFDGMFDAVIYFNFSYLTGTVWPIIYPMIIGSIPTSILVWFICYFVCKSLIISIYPKKGEN